jgi:hypothetical protein
MTHDKFLRLSDVVMLLQTIASHGYKADKHTLAMVKASLADLVVYYDKQ